MVLVSIAGVAGTAAGILGARLSAQSPAQHGKTVYDAHCVECHGESGKGDGPGRRHVAPSRAVAVSPDLLTRRRPGMPFVPPVWPAGAVV